MSKPAITVHRRVFLVGCSRSGTTVLQVLLAGHPRVYSFPETAFFIHAVGMRRRPLAWFGLTTRKAHWAIGELLKKIGREDLCSLVPERSWGLSKMTGAFVEILDRLTLEEGADTWLEKTPRHVFYVDFIKKYVDDVHIIHLIRKGQDVVTSIYDRAMKFPEKFGGQQDLHYGIQLWNRSLEASLRYVGQSGHTFVLYEQLVREPDAVFGGICDDVGIVYDPRMKEVSESSGDMVLTHEGWKSGVSEPLRPAASKFEQIFDQEMQAWISRRLRLDAYEKLRARIA